jgi:hypothetical protein
LRNTETGELLQDLSHPTQIIFKIDRKKNTLPYQ